MEPALEAAVAEEEEEGQEVVVLVVQGCSTASPQTPACLTCSRASNRSTWTRSTSERLTWPAQGKLTATEQDRDRSTDLTPTLTRLNIHMHICTRPGSLLPT